MNVCPSGVICERDEIFRNLYRSLFCGSEVFPCNDELLDLVLVFIWCFKFRHPSGLLVSRSPRPSGVHDTRRVGGACVEFSLTDLLTARYLDIEIQPAASVL